MAGDSFASLRERLLRAGIAPRHVRRYLRELTDHLADLTAEQRAAGYDEENAAIRARALLGDDAELAVAMEEQPGFRSLASRFPWLMFGVMPPLTLLLGYLLSALSMVILALAGGVIVPHHMGQLPPVPDWFTSAGMGWTFVSNFLIGPALASLLAWMALRQRLSTFWPILSVLLFVALGPRVLFSTGPHNIGIGITSILPIVPRALGGAVPIHWPTFLGQGALLCLPLAWLLRTRRKMSSTQ
jgi:hypothetical protein